MNTEPIQIQIQIDPLVATQVPEDVHLLLAIHAQDVGIPVSTLTAQILSGWVKDL